MENYSEIQFQKNNNEALVISKRLKFPQDDRTDKNFVAPLRMHFQRSKTTLDSLKKVFILFWRKQSLDAPEIIVLKRNEVQRNAESKKL